MRTKNGIKNILYSTGYYLLISVLNLLTRKLTLGRFGSELLGYFGVIDNIFSWLNIAELGVSSVILYSLYKALAERDIAQTRLIMSAYKMIYRIIGIVVLVCVVLLSFALPFFFPNNRENLLDAYILYYIEAASLLSTYFLAYCRIIFEADQKGYICLRLDMISQLFCWSVRLLIVWNFPFYPLYYGLPVFINIFVNRIILLWYCKRYPQIAKSMKITLQDLRQLNFFKDIKNFIVMKISGVIFSSTDNIILSRVFDVAMVTTTGNYLLILNRAYQMVGRFSAGITAGIGNLNYSKEVSQKRKKQVFNALELAEYYVAIISYAAFALLFQPFIQLWLGEKSLLPNVYAWVLAVTAYFNLDRKMICEYRSGLGNFEIDMWYALTGMGVNLLLSITAAFYGSIAGIAAATTVGHLIIWAGYLKVVEKKLFPGMKAEYIKRHLQYFFVATVVVACLWVMAQKWPITIWGLFARAVCALVVPFIVVSLLFFHGEDAEYLGEKMQQVWEQMTIKIHL